MNEKELETMVGEGVEKLITVRENERALQEKLSELKTIFNEENANLFEDIAEVKAMVLEQEEIVKGQRMHHYDITKDKTKLSGIGIRRDFVNNVSDLILSTKGHVPNSNPDSSYMIDIDLSIFGKSWERFFEYEKGINQEATFHEKYSLERYNKNRLFVLESFLNRERIYLTDHFRNKYEVKAKKNLEKEIKILRV